MLRAAAGVSRLGSARGVENHSRDR
jgi:hypothetical protein